MGTRLSHRPAEREAMVVEAVATILREAGGSYGMAALSGELKRSAPQVRDAVGPIRRFVDTHSNQFSLEKENGRWVIKLMG
eukprot:COSAG01_NODE_784_length_13621_cov_68.866829_15_plen_81_part_00